MLRQVTPSMHQRRPRRLWIPGYRDCPSAGAAACARYVQCRAVSISQTRNELSGRQGGQSQYQYQFNSLALAPYIEYAHLVQCSAVQ